MEEGDSYARCVRHAVSIVGGVEALAARVGVNAALVNEWTSGSSVPIAIHFARIVDIIVGKPAAKAVRGTR